MLLIVQRAYESLVGRHLTWTPSSYYQTSIKTSPLSDVKTVVDPIRIELTTSSMPLRRSAN
jgi:hypothetical protein